MEQPEGCETFEAWQSRRLPDFPHDGNTLCPRCRGISVESLSAAGGYPHSTASNIVESGKDCLLCKGLIKCKPSILYNYSLGLSLRPIHFSLAGPVGFKELVLSIEHYVRGKGRQTDTLSIPVFADEGDEAASYGVAIRHPVNGTCSKSSMDIARKWLRTCIDEHHCSQRTGLSRTAEYCPSRPSRLIDVNAFGTDSLDARLIEGNDVEEYITLSHCWGQSPSFTTTPQTLNERMTRIKIDQLPRTFKDAIDITRKLGYRYIWIDALCIVQNSEDDWAREGSKMEDIFSNCVVCIAATSAVDGSSGCYSPDARGRQDLRPELIEITSKLFNDKESTIWIHCQRSKDDQPRLDLPAPIRNSVAITRGWMLQERLLAPRILHYTTEQLLWECSEGYQSEDGLEPWYLEGSRRTAKDGKHQTGPSLSHQLSNIESTLDPFTIVHTWYKNIIAEDYSKRFLTVSEDKLPAVSGLARLVGRSTQSRYIAGLWEFGLCFGLCWKVIEPLKQSHTKPKYRAPSFSWASLDSQVDWLPFKLGHFLFGPDPKTILPLSCFKLLSWQSTPATSDEFGRISSAYLDVSGHVKWCKVSSLNLAHYRPDGINAKISSFGEMPLYWYTAWLDTVIGEEETLLSLLICSVPRDWDGTPIWVIYALLLEPLTERPQVFRRRGIAALWSVEDYDENSFQGGYHKDLITII